MRRIEPDDKCTTPSLHRPELINDHEKATADRKAVNAEWQRSRIALHAN